MEAFKKLFNQFTHQAQDQLWPQVEYSIYREIKDKVHEKLSRN